MACMPGMPSWSASDLQTPQVIITWGVFAGQRRYPSVLGYFFWGHDHDQCPFYRDMV
jgi:hypothetical protein